jgi:2-C-methyl-D-erythritol 2,4-cyclodiphosphate synthase
MNSKEIFLFCLNEVHKRGYKVNNIDSTILLQKPKLSLKIDDIISNISKISNLDKDRISVKATTTEKLGYIGESLGIMVNTTTLISKKSLN